MLPRRSALKRDELISARQELRMLDIMKQLGFDPLNLPDRADGKRGAKADVKKVALTDRLFTESSVKKTWERLRKAGRLKGAK